MSEAMFGARVPATIRQLRLLRDNPPTNDWLRPMNRRTPLDRVTDLEKQAVAAVRARQMQEYERQRGEAEATVTGALDEVTAVLKEVQQIRKDLQYGNVSPDAVVEWAAASNKATAGVIKEADMVDTAARQTREFIDMDPVEYEENLINRGLSYPPDLTESFLRGEEDSPFAHPDREADR